MIRIVLDEGSELEGLLLAYLQRNSDRANQSLIDYAGSLLKLINPSSVIDSPIAAAQTSLLTSRELEILRKINDGATNSEIASELFLSIGTVKRYSHQAYQKLEARNRIEAIMKAKKLGILPESDQLA